MVQPITGIELVCCLLTICVQMDVLVSTVATCAPVRMTVHVIQRPAIVRVLQAGRETPASTDAPRGSMGRTVALSVCVRMTVCVIMSPAPAPAHRDGSDQAASSPAPRGSTEMAASWTVRV